MNTKNWSKTQNAHDEQTVASASKNERIIFEAQKCVRKENCVILYSGTRKKNVCALDRKSQKLNENQPQKKTQKKNTRKGQRDEK